MDRRETVKVGDLEFVLAVPHERQLHAEFGRIVLLPLRESVGGLQRATKDQVRAAVTEDRALAVVETLLCKCSRKPKLTREDLADPPEGTIPLSELTDEEYLALIGWVRKRIGWTEEAAAEIAPLSDGGTSS